MTLPLKTLPLVEKWSCHNCSICCRGTTFLLSDDDLEQLGQQRWHEHPDFRGRKILVRVGLWGRRYRLAKRPDGSCVFLTEQGLCRIHAEFGEPAKPLTCRMFPYQLVPMEKEAFVTLRRYCPSAAQGRGRPLDEQLDTVRELAAQGHLAEKPTVAPPVSPRAGRSWEAFEAVARVIQRIMLDQSRPHVRRLVHAVEFCQLLQQCRLDKLTRGKFGELLELLEKSAAAEAAQRFEVRRPPGRLGAMVFRQVALEYLHLHPRLHLVANWRARWTMIRMALGFARGRGHIPGIEPALGPATFEELENPLGHLPAEVLDPLGVYLETAAASRHYALLLRRPWPLAESFQALALAHAVALWLVRSAPPAARRKRSTWSTRWGRWTAGKAIPRWPAGATGGGSPRWPACTSLSRLIVWYAR